MNIDRVESYRLHIRTSNYAKHGLSLVVMKRGGKKSIINRSIDRCYDTVDFYRTDVYSLDSERKQERKRTCERDEIEKSHQCTSSR